MSAEAKISRTAIAAIRRFPAGAAGLGFRAYHKALRSVTGADAMHDAVTYFGATIRCDLRDLIQEYIYYFGVWEPVVSRLTEKMLRPGDVYVDIGANIGYDSLLAAHCVGSAGAVIAIEASPRTYGLLTANLSRNDFKNIRTVNVAVSDAVGELSLYFGGKNNIGATTTVSSRGMVEDGRIQALPLSHILSPDEIARTRLIKIDIEGGELPVLRDICAGIDAFPDHISLVVEASPHEDAAGWADIFAAYRALGFNAYGMQNRYDLLWYLKDDRDCRLTPLLEVPDHQIDILFTRETLALDLLVN